MRVYALWNGGNGYTPGSIPEDVELFASIGQAKTALFERWLNGYWRKDTFRYVNRDPQSVLTPAVTEDSTMFLYFYDPSGSADPYPDRIIKIGPNGGIKVERC